MAKRLTDLTLELIDLADDDLSHVVDISDNTQPNGTSKKIKASNVAEYTKNFIIDGKSNAVMYFNLNATETVINTIDTPVKINATYTPEELSNFSHLTGRIQYDGVETKKFIVNDTLSIFSVSNNRKVSSFIAKNGTILSKTRSTSGSSTINEGVNIVNIGVVELATNDYIEIFVENNENGSNVIISNLYCLITELK